MPNPAPKPPDSNTDKKPAVPGGPGTGVTPLKAVLIGLAVDIGGSTLIGIVLSILYATRLSSAGLSPDQLKAAMAHIPPDSSIAVAGTVLGALCSVAGGFVCARLVRRNEYRVGGVMAALSGFLGLAMGSTDTPDDLMLLLTLSTVACVLLGVKYGRERNRRTDLPAKPPDGPPPA